MIGHHSSKKLTVVSPLLEKITRTHELIVLLLTVRFPSVSTCRTLLLKHRSHFTPSEHSKLTVQGTLRRTQATLVAQITYASHSWKGFIIAEETARLKAVLLKTCRYKYLPTDFHSPEDLLDSSDESLFRSIRYNHQHVLHKLLPPLKHTVYNLCSRGHSLTLSLIPSELMRKYFMKRMIFNSDISPCPDKKGATLFLTITLAFLGRFLHLLHQ